MKNIAKYAIGGLFAMASMSMHAVEASDVNELYIMGAVETGWSMGGTELYKVADGVFEGQVVLLNGDFKFNYQRDNWDAWVFATTADAPLQIGTPMPLTLDYPGGDYKWISSVKGAYLLTVDLNNATLTVNEAPAIYLIGGACPGGWNLGDAIALDRVGAQTYQTTATIGTGEFKFLASNRNFASSIISPAPADVVLDTAMEACYVNDNKWVNTVAGEYVFTVVLGDTPTLTVSVPEDTFMPTAIALTGAIEAEAIEVADGIFKYCGAAEAGNYTIVATAEGETRYVKAVEGAIEYVKAQDDATVFEAVAADYQITVNALTHSVEAVEYTPWEALYITGSFNSWSFDEFTKVDANVFTWEGDIEAGSEVKFMGANNFDTPALDVHPYIVNQSLSEANYCYNGGNDNKWIAPSTACYTITVNTLMQTVEVTSKASGIDTVKAASTVKAVNGAITVNSPEAAAITIYDLSGRVVAHTYGTSATVRASNGMYIVKVGTRVSKVAL